VLASIHADARPRIDFTPFRKPMRALGGVLSVAALAVIAIVLDVQVVHADDYVVRPHLGVQADGGRRFAYNPRVLDIVREIPRGTVYDRRGLPLATDDDGVIAKARKAYEALGVSLDKACPDAIERCYPLGGRAFHVLGDARTRVNWSARNTSYVERDAESTLRGFDDHSAIVDGALRRDYSAIVPLLRNRYDEDDEAVVAFRNHSRDVRLTIDAGFQLRTASIVASYAKRANGKAMAVVIDADTGEILASASSPWPDLVRRPGPMGPGEEFDADKAKESLLDRARYGLYPPGSTFKLVTAAAALREREVGRVLSDPASGRTTFTCSRLTDGRVGAKIPGWGRPVRDDILATTPHGSVNLHDGLVRSCNAYFAQLAVKLGPEPLLSTAGQLGISLTQAREAQARVKATLPQVGYGQGDVVATPLRMARVAAAIASDGVLRETTSYVGPTPPYVGPTFRSGTDGAKAGRSGVNGVPFLDPDSAHLLARYMRDAVLTGTGRSLAGHPMRIAGKTGTAEVSGKPSHSWFVGFAPALEVRGPDLQVGREATRRIAFAVLIENAGYGSGSAAPAAGEIVAAAAAAGLIE
jgi:cell division protein FtsI/penicillin-binding protein 2